MRKKHLLCLCLLCVLFLTGCAGDGSLILPRQIPANEPFPENQWGVTLAVENVIPTGMTLTCSCSDLDGWEVTTGSGFVIYTVQGEEWVPYQRTDGEFGYKAWESIAYVISDDTSVSWELDWTWLHGELPPGEYLVLKEFAASKPNGRHEKFEEFHVVSEFEVAP